MRRIIFQAPDGEERITVEFADEEWHRIERAARRAEQSLGEFQRDAVVAAPDDLSTEVGREFGKRAQGVDQKRRSELCEAAQEAYVRRSLLAHAKTVLEETSSPFRVDRVLK